VKSDTASNPATTQARPAGDSGQSASQRKRARHHRMRIPSAYQNDRQIRFFIVILTILAALLIWGVLWLINWSTKG
jgi:hypothetical protein